MSTDFKSLKITRQFLDALSEIGITEPTEIQIKAIVPAMAGQDILGIAQTGSGKTLAYLLPLVSKVKYAQGNTPRALILGPSKELVIQIFRVLAALVVHADIRIVCLYGGVGKKEQVAAIEEGVDIIVSTPGRFIDLYSYGHIFTKQINTLVLDEADRMMDMGFMGQLRQILEVIPSRRQNLLFSATFPERVERLAAEFLEFPLRIEARNSEKPVDEVSQVWYSTPNFRTKLHLLLYFLLDSEWNRVMIFCRTKDSAERVSRYLDRHEVGGVRVLHGNKSQNARINALDAFQEGELRVLVTTDVTSRGIDVSNVSHVVNFELPKSPEDYLHRIGRTARIHREGAAITFVNKAEVVHLEKIVAYTSVAIPEEPMPPQIATADYLPGERKVIDMELDEQRRKADPSFQGAFHEKKGRGGRRRK